MSEIIRIYARGILAASLAIILISVPLAHFMAEGSIIGEMIEEKQWDLPAKTEAEEAALASSISNCYPEIIPQTTYLTVEEEIYIRDLVKAQTREGKSADYEVRRIEGPEKNVINNNLSFTPTQPGPYKLEIIVQNKMGRRAYVTLVFLANQKARDV